MDQIKKDFAVKELRMQALNFVLLTASLGLGAWYIGCLYMVFIIVPLFFLPILLQVFSQMHRFSEEFQCCSERMQEQVSAQYCEKHPIYRVAYGELHLLESCILSRNKRRLLFLPLQDIRGVRIGIRLLGTKRIPVLHFFMKDGRKIKLDFDCTNNYEEDSQRIRCWLEDHLGAEKLERTMS